MGQRKKIYKIDKKIMKNISTALCVLLHSNKTKNTLDGFLVRKQTIPTELSQLFGEVSANVCR
jgi:hypothetical protein